jgi:uncharacterized protein
MQKFLLSISTTHRTLVPMVLVLITLLSLWQIRHLEVNNDLEIWIGSSGEEYQVYQNFIHNFGHDETIILVLRTDSLFTREMLELNRTLTDTLQTIAGIERVLSLASVSIPIITPTGQHEIPLIPKTVSDPERVRKRVFKYESFQDYLISADGKTTTFTLILDSLQGVEEILAAALDISVSMVQGRAELIPFGIVPMKAEINRLSTTESSVFLLIAIVVMILLNRVIFGRIREALLPVAIAVITILWTLALMATLGVTLNILLSSMPLILLVLSIALVVHFISAMHQQARDDCHGPEALNQVFRKIFRNCLFSALTTAAALGVFAFSAITPLRHFGIFASIGVLIAFGITFTLLPLIYAKSPIHPKKSRKSHWLNKRYHRLNSLVQNHASKILLFSLLLLGISISGITRLKYNTDQETYLKEHHPVRVNNQKVGDWFDGYVPMELVFQLRESFFTKPNQHLELFEEVETLLDSIPEIRSWQSPLQLFHDFMLDNKSFFNVSFIDSTILDQHPMLSRFLSADGRMLRITIKTRWMSDNEILALMHRVQAEMDVVFQQGEADFYFTGAMPIFALMGKRLVDSQIISIAGAFLLIMGAFLLLYRNLGWGLLCLIPNLLPVAGTLGLMGFLNIPVDVVTVLITAVSFGIAIDDTIHFVSHYRDALQSGDPSTAILSAYRQVAKPLIITTLLLICGFLMLVFSSYKPLVFLGVFISLNMLLALVYDLVVLPAVMHWREINLR